MEREIIDVVDLSLSINYIWTCPNPACKSVNICETDEISAEEMDDLVDSYIEQEMKDGLDDDEDDTDLYEGNRAEEELEKAKDGVSIQTLLCSCAHCRANPDDASIYNFRPPEEVICDTCGTVFFANAGELDD